MQRKLLKFSVWLLLCIIAIGFGYGVYSYLKIPDDYFPLYIVYCLIVIFYITYKIDTKYGDIYNNIKESKKPKHFSEEEKERIIMLMDTERNVIIKSDNSVEIDNNKVKI